MLDGLLETETASVKPLATWVNPNKPSMAGMVGCELQ
jgi:hypothetical protein